MRISLTSSFGWALVCAGLSFGDSATARDDVTPDAGNRPQPADANRAAAPASGDVTIPDALKSLNLTADQQNRIKAIVKNYDTQLATTWQNFTQRYMDVIELEAAMLAAIEDSLSDAQRQKLAEQRSRFSESQLAPANEPANVASGTPGTKDLGARTKPDGSDAATPDSKATKSVRGTDAKTAKSSKDGKVVEEEIVIIGITLTPEQETTADKVHTNYFAQLRALRRSIHGLHLQMVSLESQKFQEIEKVLTADQLKRLRETRTAPQGDSDSGQSAQKQQL